MESPCCFLILHHLSSDRVIICDFGTKTSIWREKSIKMVEKDFNYHIRNNFILWGIWFVDYEGILFAYDMDSIQFERMVLGDVLNNFLLLFYRCLY